MTAPPRGYGREVGARTDVIDGRYRLRGLLGRGGMAEVFRATDTATDRPVAVKVLHSVEPGSVGRFRAELDVLAHLDHPGLVKLLGSGTHDGDPYLVLDLADGPTLAAELAAGRIGVERALAVGGQVAGALAHAHRRGIVHRDVKPSNILFDDLGDARLADFGIARLAGTPSLTGTGQVVGSAPYLAPEQVAGRHAGAAADVYALGLVLIECVTGRPCYPGGHIEAAVARLHRPPGIPGDVPGWLGDVLAAMTANDPARRPTADAVADALGARQAEPVLAPTRAQDVPTTTAAFPTAAFPTGASAVTRPAPADDTAVLPETADVGPGDVTRVAPADRTAVLPPGAAARAGRSRLPSARRVEALLAAVVIAVLVVSLLAWAVAGGGGSSGPGQATTSTTAPTTVSPAPPSGADGGEAPPAAGGRENGKGHGHGKKDG